MRKNKRGTVKFGNVIVSLVVLVLIVGICCSLVYFTDGFSNDFKVFFVQIGDEKIMSDHEGISVKLGEDLNVRCSYLLSGVIGAEGANGYSYEIVPNVDSEHDFIVQADGISPRFSDLEPFTDSFEVTEEKGGFRLKVSETVPELIQKQFAGEITIMDKSIEWDKYSYLALVVYSGDKKHSIRIPLKYIYSVTGITLSESEVIL